MSNVISIKREIKTPSESWQASVTRVRSTMTQNRSGKWVQKVNIFETLDLNLCANIDYYKEHGKLPNTVDMDKVRGKGDAYKYRRDM